MLVARLYRSAVSSLLACFSAKAGFYASDSGLDPVSCSLTVLESYAAPKAWAEDPCQPWEAQRSSRRW